MSELQDLIAELAKTDPAVAARVADAVKKESPGVADVHATTALGNEKPNKGRRRRKPVATVTDTIAPHKEGSPGAGAVEKLTLADALRSRANGVLDVDIIKEAERTGALDVAQIVRDGWKKPITFGKESDANMYDKAEVGYVDLSTGDDFCAICKHMAGVDACEIVKGAISPGGWCKKFASRWATAADDDDEPPVRKKDAPRQLKMMDKKHAHTPFPWDAAAMASMRPDQVPRFLSAITNPGALEPKTVKLSKLTALQDRVDAAKVQMIRDQGDGAEGTSHDGRRPVVVKLAKGKRVIGDGHHRLTAHWLDGDDKAEVHYVDLTPVDESITATDEDPDTYLQKENGPADWRADFQVQKMEPDQQRIWGWASIAMVGDEAIIDKQGDIIPIEELDKAAHDFMLHFRDMGDMHESVGVGRAIASMVFTPEWEAKGIVAKDDKGRSIYGWLIGFQVDDEDLWKEIKGGRRPEFSIGGRGRRVDA